MTSLISSVGSKRRDAEPRVGIVQIELNHCLRSRSRRCWMSGVAGGRAGSSVSLVIEFLVEGLVEIDQSGMPASSGPRRPVAGRDPSRREARLAHRPRRVRGGAGTRPSSERSRGSTRARRPGRCQRRRRLSRSASACADSPSRSNPAAPRQRAGGTASDGKLSRNSAATGEVEPSQHGCGGLGLFEPFELEQEQGRAAARPAAREPRTGRLDRARAGPRAKFPCRSKFPERPSTSGERGAVPRVRRPCAGSARPSAERAGESRAQGGRAAAPARGRSWQSRPQPAGRRPESRFGPCAAPARARLARCRLAPGGVEMDLRQVDESRPRGDGAVSIIAHASRSAGLEFPRADLLGDRSPASECQVRLVDVHRQAAQHRPVQLPSDSARGPARKRCAPLRGCRGQGGTGRARKSSVCRLRRSGRFSPAAPGPGDWPRCVELHGDLVALPERLEAENLHVQRPRREAGCRVPDTG